MFSKNGVLGAGSQSFGKALALGGGIAGIVAAVSFVAFGTTSLEATVTIVFLLMLAVSLAIALGIQALTHGRSSRYAARMPQIMQLAERLWKIDPSVLTANQATAACDELVESLAQIFQQISCARCHVSIEVLTPAHEGVYGPLRRSSDYVVVNLSRDSSIRPVGQESRRQHPVDGNSSYRALFRSTACSASFFREDIAEDADFATTELGGEYLSIARRQKGRWPLHYRSTIVVSVCNAERCGERRDHRPIGFLWLRSPEPRVFDERYDVELMQRMGRAVSPLVTRCVQATMPTHDFRRQHAAAP